MKKIPEALQGFLLPYNWDVTKVWALDAPSQQLHIDTLAFMFELPFWSSVKGEMRFDVKPIDVLNDPSLHPHQWQRVIQADLRYPIDLIYSNNRYYILDGLHRLARLKQQGLTTVKVRIHSPNIQDFIEIKSLVALFPTEFSPSLYNPWRNPSYA
ncbi:hypothetical protein CS022_13400 [Veronia nyctiphanis]|uniref:Uncharacterized protein n=1 Tax=Veronia nyctiphanis TaxID=1278244 RepID=A0A4Q0YQI8_9GAMM|nr:ParB N-terminal domain-containing protein [Veronia nyctiphanis]RXJ72845.1 hypothetical protein CS022_13400 [Veronia nyctiphanis]